MNGHTIKEGIHNAYNTPNSHPCAKDQQIVATSHNANPAYSMGDVCARQLLYTVATAASVKPLAANVSMITP